MRSKVNTTRLSIQIYSSKEREREMEKKKLRRLRAVKFSRKAKINR